MVGLRSLLFASQEAMESNLTFPLMADHSGAVRRLLQLTQMKGEFALPPESGQARGQHQHTHPSF